MASSKVVVMLDAALAEKLAAICEQEASLPARSSGTVPAELGEAGKQLRAALQQEGEVEETVEYRVALRTGAYVFPESEKAAKEEARFGLLDGEAPLEAQSRQTFLGPWVALKAQERADD